MRFFLVAREPCWQDLPHPPHPLTWSLLRTIASKMNGYTVPPEQTLYQQDVSMMDADLLDEFLFPHNAGTSTHNADKDDDQGMQNSEDEIFNTFINTELEQQSHQAHQTQQSSHMQYTPDHSDRGQAPQLQNNLPSQFISEDDPLFPFEDPQNHFLASVNVDQWQDQVPPMSIPVTTTTTKSVAVEDDVQQQQQQQQQCPVSLSYSKQCDKLVDNQLGFGRSKPIQSIYLNPQDFLEVRDEALSLDLKVSGMPSTSRVETQIKLEFSISPPPREYLIHLPTDCITKQKFYLDEDITTYPKEIQDQVLYLESFLICASNNKPTYVCTRCVKREQRRASRRKSGLSDNMLWCNNENRRAVVFNSKQVFVIKDVNCTPGTKNFELSTRIVCYCRHHKEPEGFKLLFVLRDSHGKVLGRDITNPIMIMDKKPSKENGNTTAPHTVDSATDTAVATDTSSNTKLGHTTTVTSEFSGSESKAKSDVVRLSAPAPMLSPTSIGEESSEPQTTDAGAVSKPSQFVASIGSSAAAAARTTGYKRKKTWPEAPTLAESSSMTASVAKSDRSFSTSSSNAPLPVLVPSTSSIQQHQIQQRLSYNHSTVDVLQGLPDISAVPQPDRPFIQRVIPSQGPIKGGIEVTLLGSNFKPGMIVKFGENKALSTQCWSDSTIVTYLPPASVAGQVLVTIFEKEESNPELLGNMSNSKAIFTYLDDTDRQLIELALQIVGLKMNGKLEDARNIAKRIVGNDAGSSAGSSPNSSVSPTNAAGNSAGNGYSQLYYSDENLLLRVVKLLNPSSNLSMCTEEGQTMLHLACLKGYFQLASTLVKKGTRVDAKDSFGFTPLHFACVNGDPRIIRLLAQCKADVTTKATNGVAPRDLFVTNHDTDDVRYHEYLDEVLSILNNSSDVVGTPYSISRKMSDSSFQSSVFDDESLNSIDDGFCVHISKMVEDSLSADSDYESSDFEEDGDESLLAGDEMSREVSRECSPDVSEPVRDDGPESVNQVESSIWNRVLNAFNDDLPKYEDLFPNSTREKYMQVTVPQHHQEILQRTTETTTAEDSQTSSEDEEEALQVRFNRFFQQRQNFQNDKMLLFFWLPLMVILLSSFLIFKFGSDGNTVHHLSNEVSKYLRLGLAKVMLGNERMKGVFMESLNNFQNNRAIGSEHI